MDVEQNDWLDQRLAAKDDYIPDAGFTAQVLERLPAQRPVTVGQIRWRVLSISVTIAFCLFLLQIVPLLKNVGPLTARYISPAFLDHLMALVARPAVLYSVAGGAILLGFAAIPLLRRWA